MNLYYFERKTIMMIARRAAIKLMCIVLFLGMPMISFSQNINPPDAREIKGTVVDAKSVPLENATVKLKATTIATTTNKDGKFTIKVPASQKAVVLVVSFTGYGSQEVKVNDNAPLSITLVEAIDNLNDVVVIGYGSIKKKDLTGFL